MLGNQHSHALVLSFISSFLYLHPPSHKKKTSLVWHRRFKKDNGNANSQPQLNIQTLRHPRRNASGSLRRRRRVNPLADENHRRDELVVAVVVVAAAMMVVTVVMTTKVVMAGLVQGHRGSVCGVPLFK